MQKLKCAIIGCGRISYKHVEAIINNSEETELVALCDLIEDRAIARQEQYKEKFPEAKVSIYTDYKKMLKEVDIDYVAIATESGYHGEISLDCLNEDVNIIIEKPMAMTLEEIDSINELSDKKGLKVAVSHQNRFNPPIQKLRKAIDEGKFGNLINGTARILWTRDQNYYDMAPWRGTKALDGGTLMNQCIHNIDLLLWMMGSEVVSVKSERGTFLRDIEMEDFGAILLRFANGSIGIIEGSACVYPKNLEETLSIFGETGTAVIGGLAVNEIKTWNFEDENEKADDLDSGKVENVYGNGHTPLYKDFIDAVNNDTQPLVTGYEARKPVEVILKSYEEKKWP
ncbi:MAG: Gfo/Idh/MocA family oxidoreductase [Miniphocaeibacter sp.]|uniref:Gfo/Idh/MocA family protein n=1 Tax=Miniphocaeibacter sp. TaxID=3100973 RepID=UPI0017F475B5|nr:Gfo/Idh/MocA family oxidoreductase [Gallicola sp.]